ncbi:MAG TPA: TolC family protein [Chitinophagaceae bacterium]|nr:TolC family protein [Chitinophagaceae bacterium]
MKRFFLTTGILCAFGVNIFSQNNTSGKLTLQQCIETGIANNLNVLQTDLQAQADEISWKQAKLNRLPTLNGSAGYAIRAGRSIDPFTNTYINENNKSSDFGLGSGVTVFNGFSMQNLVKQNRLNYEASKMTLQQRKDNLTLSIILAYLQVLNNEDQLVQARNQMELTKQQLDRLETLNKEGSIRPSDLSDVKGQYAGDQVGIINAQTDVETAKINLSEFMNVPYDKNMAVERLDVTTFTDKYADTPEKIYETALEQFAQIKSVNYSTQSAEKAVKVAKGGLFPLLGLSAGYGTNYSNTGTTQNFINTTYDQSFDYVVVNGGQSPVFKKQDHYSNEKISYFDQLNNNRNSNIRLGLQIPIFNSFQQRNRIKLAKIDLKNNVLIEKTARTQLQRSIEQAYVNMTAAFDKHKILLEQVDAFTESFHAAEIRFNSGVGTSYDYLLVKNSLDRATINLINAKYDYVLRTKILDFYKGMKLW